MTYGLNKDWWYRHGLMVLTIPRYCLRLMVYNRFTWITHVWEGRVFPVCGIFYYSCMLHSMHIELFTMSKTNMKNYTKKTLHFLTPRCCFDALILSNFLSVAQRVESVKMMINNKKGQQINKMQFPNSKRWDCFNTVIVYPILHYWFIYMLTLTYSILLEPFKIFS